MVLALVGGMYIVHLFRFLIWKGTETLSAFEEEVLEENRRKLSFALCFDAQP